MITGSTTIERFDVTVGPFTFQARCAVPHPAAFAAAYRDSKDKGGDSQQERSSYMRDIVSLPRGEMEQRFLAEDGALLRALFAGLPTSSVDEYLDVLGSPEAMRGVLDWYRASLSTEDGVPRGIDPDFPTIQIPTLRMVGSGPRHWPRLSPRDGRIRCGALPPRDL